MFIRAIQKGELLKDMLRFTEIDLEPVGDVRDRSQRARVGLASNSMYDDRSN